MHRWRPGLGWVLPKSDSLIGTCLGPLSEEIADIHSRWRALCGPGSTGPKGQDERPSTSQSRLLESDLERGVELGDRRQILQRRIAAHPEEQPGFVLHGR